MSQHTPGPWYFDAETMPPTQKVKCPSCNEWRESGDFTEPAFSVVAGGEHEHDYENQTWICGVGFASVSDPIDLANARLIAAAPALLAALRAMLPLADISLGESEEIAFAAIMAAEDAVSLATGEPYSEDFGGQLALDALQASMPREFDDSPVA